jgi:hypothetical protein
MTKAEIVTAVARTLGERTVRVRRVAFNERRSAAHVWASAGGEDVFAKVLLADWLATRDNRPLPGPRPVRLRSAVSLLATEWETSWQLFPLSSDEAGVPRPLAVSLADKAILWHEGGRETMRGLLRAYTAFGTSRKWAEAASGRLGAFLRRVHDRFAHGDESLHVGQLLEAVRQHAAGVSEDMRPFLATATRVLQALERELNTSRLRVPVSLIHGDLQPSNVLWDGAGRIWLVDFEHSRHDMAILDLVQWIYNIRVALLYPLVDPRRVLRVERAFWEGYGGESRPDLVLATRALAAVWIFCFLVPERIPYRRRTARIGRRVALALYEGLLKTRVIAWRMPHILGGVPIEGPR